MLMHPMMLSGWWATISHWSNVLNQNAISFIHLGQQETVIQELFRKILIIIIIISSSIPSIICSLKMCGDCKQLSLEMTQKEVSIWPHLTRKELSLPWQGEQNYATCDFFLNSGLFNFGKHKYPHPVTCRKQKPKRLGFKLYSILQVVKRKKQKYSKMLLLTKKIKKKEIHNIPF